MATVLQNIHIFHDRSHVPPRHAIPELVPNATTFPSPAPASKSTTFYYYYFIRTNNTIESVDNCSVPLLYGDLWPRGSRASHQSSLEWSIQRRPRQQCYIEGLTTAQSYHAPQMKYINFGVWCPRARGRFEQIIIESSLTILR